MIAYYLHYNSTTGAITGAGTSPDGTIPSDGIECTQAQYQTSNQWQVVNGAIVSAPASVLLAQAQSAQIIVLKTAYQTAINAPVTFTNAAGVTSTYAFGNSLSPSGSNAQDLLTQIIAAGSAAWKAGVWFDTNGVAQTMTFADLQELAVAIEAAQTVDEQDLMTKMAEVQAATSISAVQAITF